jgi:selenocysteine-specific elongation factor
LAGAPAVVTSAVTGAGLVELRLALDGLLDRVPLPLSISRVRLWVDRSFTITGAGTVVTGTLTAGTLAVGDHLDILSAAGANRVTVRGLQSHGRSDQRLIPVRRVAVNLRGVPADQVRRGDALVTPDSWPTGRLIDVRAVSGAPLTEAPERVTVHVGTEAVPARLRPFDGTHARIALARALPLVLGDRVVLQHPGTRRVLGGALVLDADPPTLTRRGAGRARLSALQGRSVHGDAIVEVARRGAVPLERLHRWGVVTAEDATPPDGVHEWQGWWVHDAALRTWQHRLRGELAARVERDPLDPSISRGATVDLLGLPDPSLVDLVVSDTGLEQHEGRIWEPATRTELGPADTAVSILETRLRAAPFDAPDAGELTALGLGVRELAAAERAGRVLRLTDGIVLLPSGPAQAMHALSGLPQPFTTSQARQVLGTTRRVTIPLLEHLDVRGWTRRVDGAHRQVVRAESAEVPDP